MGVVKGKTRRFPAEVQELLIVEEENKNRDVGFGDKGDESE